MLVQQRTNRRGGNASGGLGLGSYSALADVHQASVRAGFFEDQGKHPDSDLTFAELATVLEVGPEPHSRPRPFMRVAYEKNVEKYVRQVATLINDVLDEKTSVDDGLAALGETMQEDIKDSLIFGDWPPNMESTIKRKGFDFPLVETGALYGAVTFRVTLQRGSKRFRGKRAVRPGREQ